MKLDEIIESYRRPSNQRTYVSSNLIETGKKSLIVRNLLKNQDGVLESPVRTTIDNKSFISLPKHDFAESLKKLPVQDIKRKNSNVE